MPWSGGAQHYPHCSVEHRTEIVNPPEVLLRRRDNHPYGPLQRPLGSYRAIHRRLGEPNGQCASSRMPLGLPNNPGTISR